MDINYFMKIQNACGFKNKREKELARVNREMSRHFEDTYDTEKVLLNDKLIDLMIIKDSDGNTFKKKIKSCHNEKFNLGDYVVWNNQYWLITLLDTDDKVWNRGYMYLCTVPLRWQSSDGKIIERWGYSEDFTKYSSGVIGNNTLRVGDNQYGITIPIDKETKRLKRDMRFPIDFDDAIKPEIYSLTNRKVKLNDNSYFNRGGTMIVTMSFNAFDNTNDRLVTLDSGKKAWICDYHSPTTLSLPSHHSEITDLSVDIIGDTDLRYGITETYKAWFSDKDGNLIGDVNFKWNIISNFKVNKIVDNTNLQLSTSEWRCIGSSFLLQIVINDLVVKELKITVVSNI